MMRKLFTLWSPRLLALGGAKACTNGEDEKDFPELGGKTWDGA